jgi:phosphoribosylformylglycinamidine synthase, clade II
MSVKRIYVEKKKPYAVRAKELKEELENYLSIKALKDVRILIRYDIEGVKESVLELAKKTIFSEPPMDILYEENFKREQKDFVFSVEYLPGQFDQRADSAIQCVRLLDEEENPVILSAVTYIISGNLSEEDKKQIMAYCINPVDSRVAKESKLETLVVNFDEPADVQIFDSFNTCSEAELKELYNSLGLAMTFKDFIHIRNYFENDEKRNPSMTEIRVLDTYWSDHCRHTTFQTELKSISIGDGYYRMPIKDTYDRYIYDRNEIFTENKDKYICLMDLALLAMRKLKKEGKLEDMEVSEEINACSIIVPVEIDGITEEWLINFKNETHNHPTEIEPFGGAATCLGGAIRDPLSGRTYVYQAMRITGAADPTKPLCDTLAGKLPQRKIVTGAAEGYSAYGNQIGLATGYVKEIYHAGYEAKRMEIGAVIGAAPRKNIIRETAAEGDIILLLGGRTGRDGCGGATGSSKAHTTESIETCGAEVQKGNAPTERKLQRLFRDPEASILIKKCNDFGAGGVSVAIGELADGLRIDLDKVTKKYAGLDGTEIAISESQERMALVIAPKDLDKMLKLAEDENLEAVEVAVVTKESRLVMSWRGKTIVDIDRKFLDTNGAHQDTDVLAILPEKEGSPFIKAKINNVTDELIKRLSDINNCSQKGLVEMFDSSIGAGSVLMPYGGKTQLTEIQTMVAKLPLLKGETDTVTMMSYGFDPNLSSWSPYHGAIYAVISSVAKIVSSGGDYSKIRFTFQEYFKRMTENPESWGEPFLALLGAYNAQLGLELPSIGGKDSMSGTFQDINVPPTLVSFAVNVGDIKNIITPELKKAGNKLVLCKVQRDEFDLPNYDLLTENYSKIFEDIKAGNIISAYAVEAAGIASAIVKMAFGNELGVNLYGIAADDLFAADWGSIVAEVEVENVDQLQCEYKIIGEVIEDTVFKYADSKIILTDMLSAWKKPLENVFPSVSGVENITEIKDIMYKTNNLYVCKHKVAKPTVFIPVFPGTNCEIDSMRAFENAGAEVITTVFRNLSAKGIRDSIKLFAEGIRKSQIVMFPGGFSAGDEPDGSAKFFATAFRNAVLKEEIEKLINERDGLMLGICNGFQALIKLGLLPYGEITVQNVDSPTLARNTISRHVSKMAYTKVVSNKSPWLYNANLGSTYVNPISHGEGRFVADDEWIAKLFANGQVATQYTNINGIAVMNEEWNINGSYAAIEGITDASGRIFGKMAHSERKGKGVAINIIGEQDLKIFEAGVEYFL